MLKFSRQVWQSLFEEIEKIIAFRRPNLRFLKEWTLLIGTVLLMVCCQGGEISYHEAMERCMEQVEVSEFILESGEKGKSYRNFDINCLMGAQIPAFSTRTLEGKEVTTEDLRGKINVFNFWFAACKPSVAEIPALNLLTEKYKDKEIDFFALSVDDERRLRAYLEQHDYHFTHLLNGKEIIRETFQHKSGFPTTIVTDTDLRIIEIIVGRKYDATTVAEAVNELDTFLETLGD